MNPEHIKFLCSPKSKKPLFVQNAKIVDGKVAEGTLIDEDENKYPIVNYIPRFISMENYCDSFSIEWEKHKDILFRCNSDYKVYEKRFYEETKWEKDLRGELILEVGCGSGALTEYALKTNGMVISFDASLSVEQTYNKYDKRCNLLVIQASIYDLPLADNMFDKIFCFGVLQHTPNPKDSLEALVYKLKSGGRIASDIYLIPPPNHPYTGLMNSKYFIRRVTIWITPNLLHAVIKLYVNLMWSITRIIASKLKNGIQINRRLLFDDYPCRLRGMNPSFYKEFACLDIFDMLSPKYDYPSTVEEFTNWHKKMRLINIDVHEGYNGIEGRAVKV